MTVYDLNGAKIVSASGGGGFEQTPTPNRIQFNSILQFNSIQFNSIQFNSSIQSNSQGYCWDCEVRASAHATANSRISLLFHFVFFSLFLREKDTRRAATHKAHSRLLPVSFFHRKVSGAFIRSSQNSWTSYLGSWRERDEKLKWIFDSFKILIFNLKPTYYYL